MFALSFLSSHERIHSSSHLYFVTSPDFQPGFSLHKYLFQVTSHLFTVKSSGISPFCSTLLQTSMIIIFYYFSHFSSLKFLLSVLSCPEVSVGFFLSSDHSGLVSSNGCFSEQSFKYGKTYHMSYDKTRAFSLLWVSVRTVVNLARYLV